MSTPGVHSSWFIGLHETLREDPPRIVLSDGGDGRVVDAADLLVAAGVVQPVLTRVAGTGVPGPAHEGVEVVDLQVGTDPLEHGLSMVVAGEAEGLVGGAVRPTADILRAALRTVGLESDVDLVSSSFLMILEDRTP